jgi:hypothetical protein
VELYYSGKSRLKPELQREHSIFSDDVRKLDLEYGL